ncbi:MULTISPECIES: PLP-dependent aminotransferase family protein [Lysinibacillus]|uniref:MocR-like pyridoxine biosynthesis transcription factor PdxR n=1 Tax=Lysinibacillus TaxID=400634 RepID=UPI00055D1F29|nr:MULTISPECIES: PLP-dependent aminotransferase family protein [Lysinibacillus]KUF32565.1 GntR family transcriptional regulator [Lysinibacillus sp. F5]SCY79180.1 GntR family transcriptional regulator / MocR family aminotransferase [Lysinibacillus sp. SG9]SDB40836.1 GntR family transcriptional regulator / MocR family aminotransferase [Lysinibacillus sp. TC-37]SFT01000.1 GntR family transcriptional regulator / MocR family aminotransferase [Lysinibacillus sp. SG55]
MLEMTPNLHNEEPLYLQLYSYIKAEIQNGNILAQTKLPSQRSLAKHLQISRNTVDAAYQQLLAEGYVISKEREGLYVVELERGYFQTSSNHFEPQLATPQEQQLPSIKYNFNYGDINLKDFPYKIWRTLTLQSLNEEQAHLLLYGDPQGELELRNYIASYLYEARGVQCQGDQIVIGAGLQFLMGIVCHLIGRNELFAMEDPGYYRVRYLFKDHGIKVKPIPLDEHGIHISQLRNSRVKAVYVTPSHQFPIGTVMPISRRLALLEWAKDENAYIIEDDYDGEFRYAGKPIPALQGLDSNDRVIYMGTFSKSLIPSIKLSYMVLPRELTLLFNNNNYYVQTVSRLHQHTLQLFMESGHWERHLNKTRNGYKRRYEALLKSIHQILGDNVKIHGASSGLHILLEPNNKMSEEELIETAKRVGVKVYPTSIFYANPSVIQHAKVLLGFANLGVEEIDKGIKLLKHAWFDSPSMS